MTLDPDNITTSRGGDSYHNMASVGGNTCRTTNRGSGITAGGYEDEDQEEEEM